MSGHRYIMFAILINIDKRQTKLVYDFDSTDWDDFKKMLEEQCNRQLKEKMTVDQKAEELQKIYSKVCVGKIARKEIPERHNNDWWNEDLKRCKSAVQAAKRKWQVSRRPDDLSALKMARRAFKRTIKLSKEKHIQVVANSTITKSPWYRAWAVVTNKNKCIIKNNVQKDDGSFAESEEEANEYLVHN